MNKVFCPAPWTNRMYHANSDIAVCCRAKPTSPAATENLKQQIQNNEASDTCKACWEMEANNATSLRQILLNLDPAFTIPSGSPTETVTNIMINLGSLCNAECIMCNGSTSSSRNNWAKIHDKKNYIKEENKVAKKINLIQYPNLEMITLLGGEPAIHPDTRTILRSLIDAGYANKIDINLNTNSSSLDQKLLELLLQFRDIFVTLSLDSAGKYFEYQRRPLKWNTVSAIAEQWIDISFKSEISYVVSSITIWGFNDFIQWYKTLINPPPVRFDLVDNGKGIWSLSTMTQQQKMQWKTEAVEHPLKAGLITMLENSTYDQAMYLQRKEQIKIEDITAALKYKDIFPNETAKK